MLIKKKKEIELLYHGQTKIIPIVYSKRKSLTRFDARYWMLGAGALGPPRGVVWGGWRVQDGEHMYTCGGFILIFGKTNTIM